MFFSQLCEKEVISAETGARLGTIDDVEFDEHTASIRRLVILGRRELFGLGGKSEDIVIDWADIETIGADIILVKNERERPATPAKRPVGLR